MNGLLLSGFFLFALPCALGLQCYSWKITGPKSRCTSVSNSSIINCTGCLDARVTTALTIKTKVGGLEMEAYTMACGEKAVCSNIEEGKCIPGRIKEYVDKILAAEVTKCGMACCQTPMCNKNDLVSPKPIPKALATYTSASLLVSGISLVLGFVMSA